MICAYKNAARVFKVGLTGTPINDCFSMENIVRFVTSDADVSNLLFEADYAYKQLGLFICRKQKQFITDFELPEVIITNVTIKMSPDELAIYASTDVESHARASHAANAEYVKTMLRAATDKWLTLEEDNQQVDGINPAVFREKTLSRMRGNVEVAQQEYARLNGEKDKLITSLRQKKLVDSSATAYQRDAGAGVDTSGLYDIRMKLEHIEAEIREALRKCERAQCVLDRYVVDVNKIDEIMAHTMEIKSSDSETTAEEPLEDNDVYCTICYGGYTSDGIAYYRICGHYCCMYCYKTWKATSVSHTTAACLTCRVDHSGPGMVHIISNFFMQNIGSKMKEVLRIVNTAQLAGGDTTKFIIYTQFDDYMARIIKILRKFELVVITSDDLVGQANIAAIPFTVLMLSSVRNASGLDLQLINHVIIMEPFQNYLCAAQVEKQLIGRAHRIGQLRTVHVHRLINRGTIEETIYNEYLYSGQ
jgi:hypothetical protein